MKEAEYYADLLWEARMNNKNIPPLRDEIQGGGIEFAYEIQEINNSKREDSESRIIGRKIGLTSKIVQEQLGVDQPDFGALFAETEILNGQTVSISELQQPKIEAEIAIVLAEDLDYDNITTIDIFNAIDYILPSIEIVGSRIKDWDIKIWDTVADNASASHFVLGHTPKTIDEIDIVNCAMELFRNDQLVSTGKGADCLGSPLNALHWLANTMNNLGTPLEEGDLILTGALGKMVPVEPGDYFRVSFGGLGEVCVGFTR